MHKSILGILALAFSASSMAATFENVVGEYEVTYKTGFIFAKEESFKLNYLETKQGQYGDIEFESDELGFCSNQGDSGANGDYGYVVMNVDDTLTKLDGVNEATHVQSTVLCDSGWYQLSIETAKGDLENAQVGDEIKAGVYLRNGNMRDLLDKKATIKKLN